MPDREKVVAWLTEISLRPCDFTRDDFDAIETERLANDAIELLKEQEAEISFLKGMQLKTIQNMSNEDIGNAVAELLRLKG